MKKYYAELGGVRWEITPERAEQIKRLQKLIADQRERKRDAATDTEDKPQTTKHHADNL